MKVHLFHLQTGTLPSEFCRHASSEQIFCKALCIREIEYMPLNLRPETDVLVVCSSKNAVAAVLAQEPGFFRGKQCAAVGSATADALRNAGAREVCHPIQYNAEHLAKLLVELHRSRQLPKRILFLRGERLKAEFKTRILSLLPEVAFEERIVYRTTRCSFCFDELLAALTRGEPILLCISSRAALEDFLRSADAQLAERDAMAIRSLQACIFAETLREDVERLGLPVVFCASGRTLAEFGSEVQVFAKRLLSFGQ